MEEERHSESDFETGNHELNKKEWECFVCCETFAIKGNLTRHLATHRAERPHKCQFCDSCFRRPDHLYQHHMAMHPTKLLKFECDECHEVFNTKVTLRLHKTEHVGAHQCEFCGSIFIKKKFLTAHKKLHTANKPYCCEYCLKSFTSKYFLGEHQKRHTEETPFKCEICKIYFQKESSLRGHHTKQHMFGDDVSTVKKNKKIKVCDNKTQSIGLTLNSEETSFICDKCEMVFVSKRCMQDHECKGSGILVENVSDDVIVVQRNKTTKNTVCDYTCKICGKKYIEKSLLSAHLISHRNKEGYTELGIDAEDTTNTEQSPDVVDINNDTSLVNVVTINGRKYYKCDICHKQFTTNSYLTVHKQAHNGVKSHSCQYCSKHFTTKCNLKIHIRLHTGEKPYTCEFCDKKFSDMSARNSHRRSHIANVDFDHKQFVTNSYVKGHKDAQSSIKPHTCDFCGKHFTLKCNLKVHIRLHTGEKPYTCEFCDKRFSDMTARNSHRRSHASKK